MAACLRHDARQDEAGGRERDGQRHQQRCGEGRVLSDYDTCPTIWCKKWSAQTFAGFRRGYTLHEQVETIGRAGIVPGRSVGNRFQLAIANTNAVDVACDTKLTTAGRPLRSMSGAAGWRFCATALIHGSMRIVVDHETRSPTPETNEKRNSARGLTLRTRACLRQR